MAGYCGLFIVLHEFIIFHLDSSSFYDLRFSHESARGYFYKEGIVSRERWKIHAISWSRVRQMEISRYVKTNGTNANKQIHYDIDIFSSNDVASWFK